MGFFSKLRKGANKKANEAIDAMTSPEKEMDLIILQLEEQRKQAYQELISYKATAKQMEQDMNSYREKAEQWEKKAMAAVKAGDDELAREALKQKKLCLIEVAKIKRDRNEADGYAADLNRSRKQAEVKLQMLKLKKNTLTAQIAQARGKNDPLSSNNELFDKFAAAEQRIDDAAIQAEVDAAMQGEELGGGARALSDRAAVDRLLATGDADEALAELKAKVAERRKALPDGKK